MKKISELTDFYYKTLYPTLKELEDDRKHLRYRIIVIGVIITFITLLIAISMKDIIAQNFDLLFFLGASYIGVGAVTYKFLIKDYTKEFKDKIISPLIKEIDSNLRYTSTAHISIHHFKRSKIFTKSPDRFNGNDFVKGKIDGIDIQFSDIHAEKEYKDSKGRRHYDTIFKGLFIVSEFNKNFKGRTIVLPDTAQSTFGDLIGGWLQSKNMNRSELVKMDDPKFEKEFVVYSTNQIEARYILSHALMEKLLNFQKRSKHPVCVSFVGGSIYIAIQSHEDQFEPSIFHSLLKYKIAMEYVSTLHLAIGIVEELKLNQKLWSKT
jgi:hypothetical protein